MESEWIAMFRQIRKPCGTGNSFAARADPPVLPSEKCEDRRTIDTFRAVLRSLFGVQCLSGRNLPKPFLFVLYSESGSSGRPILTENIRRGITRGSDNLPVQIVWIKGDGGVGRNAEREYIPSGGAVVRFTGIRNEKTDHTLVKGIIHRWGMERRGFELEVEKRGGFSMVRNSCPVGVE